MADGLLAGAKPATEAPRAAPDRKGGAPFAPVIPVSELAAALEKCLGIRVTLPTVAGWTVEQRAEARLAIESGGERVSGWLAAMVPPVGEIEAAEGSSSGTEPKPPVAEKPAVPTFASANRGPGITPDMARIVEHVYAVDAWRDYEDLERNLEIGEERGNYATVAKHVDGAEQRARRAHALYLSAKLELLRFEGECEKVAAGMRQKALDALEEEKLKGERKKAITNDDVRDQTVRMFPDEVADQEEKLAKLKGAVAHVERLAELWKGRCHTASVMLSNLRK